jgi:phage FluMu protein Com
MAIKFYCKSCQKLLSIAGRKAGSDIDCPQCGQTQTVPSEQAAEAAMAMIQSHQLGETDPTAADSPFVVQDPFDTGGVDAGELDQAMPFSADRPPPVGMILLSRQTLVFQGILLAVLPIAGVALGYFFGRCDSRPPVDAAPLKPAREEVLMQGKIVWEETTGDNGGEIVGDEGAVIIVLPDGVFPESTLSIQDIRPQDPHPSSDNKSLKKIDELGGLYARADALGLFPLVFPDSGKYHILLISRNAARPQDTPIDEDDLGEIKRYFIRGDDLIGRYKYRWSTEEISRESPPIEHSFGRNG